MARKDIEKDSDRPHYYSQFWLDVAAGRRTIGGSQDETEDMMDVDMVEEPVITRKAGRNTSVDADGYQETIVHPEVETDEFDVDDTLEDQEIPTIEMDTADETDLDIPYEEELPEELPEPEELPQEVLPEEEPVPEEPAPEEPEEYFEDEEEEEGWDTPRGRKKVKPTRQAKLPTKKPKREPRRGY